MIGVQSAEQPVWHVPSVPYRTTSKVVILFDTPWHALIHSSTTDLALFIAA